MEKSLHTLTLGRRSNPILRIFCKVSIVLLEIARSSGLAGIKFRLRLEGEIRIRKSCFSVTDLFLTTFYYVEKLNGILR